MPALHFSFQDFDTEIDAISKIAARFIAPVSHHVLPSFKSNLEQIRSSQKGRVRNWGIPERTPLLTEATWGGYEPNGKGGMAVFASISSTWDIEPLDGHNPASRQLRKFALVGIASTRVRLFEGEPGQPVRELAMWRTEVGDDASPGCHFHMQVLGEIHNPPYPRQLPVPRFPGLLMTPMSVLEFVLAELFQDEWRMHVARPSNDIRRWQPIQKKWLGNLLSWQHDKVMNLDGSPWTSLKGAKPDSDLFL
jgi:hypothetical protein